MAGETGTLVLQLLRMIDERTSRVDGTRDLAVASVSHRIDRLDYCLDLVELPH